MAKRYVVLCFTFAFLWTVCLAEVTFRVDEEKPNGTFVGNISDSSDLQTLLSDEVLGSLKYSFLVQGYPHSALFIIVNNTGIIYTSKVLDRETLCGFSDSCDLNLEVAVQSTISQFFRKEKVNVILNDVNDNKPEYSSSSVQVEISESVSVNSSYQLEAAVDRDIGNNSLKGYRLISDSDVFGLKTVQTLDGGSVVSLVVIKLLDHEKRDRYNVTVIAHDGGSPPMSSSLLVNIKIIDVNDNSPVFSSPAYNISVNEISAIDSVVVTLSATDADTSANGVALYRFSPLLRGDITKYFSINSTNGDVTVRSPLDLVQGKTMKGVVECIDHGSPPLIAQTLLTINIADTTNDRPSINLNLLADGKVSEYAQPGTTVAHVAVLDPDTGRNGIVRCLLQSKVFELQGLDVDEYKIIVARGIDRETDSSFDVTLTCVDAGEPPLNRSVSFNVQVKDENDNNPLFSKSIYRGNITENNMIGDVVLKVSASDIDTGLNGKIKFSSPEVIIDVKDANDNKPIIIAPSGLNNSVSLPYTTPENTLLVAVSARDADFEDNGDVSYLFAPGTPGQNVFQIGSRNGLLKTKRELKIEDVGSYNLVVLATDGGVPPLVANVSIEVVVFSSNETMTASQSEENALVVIILGTLTGVITVAVIITIVIIRRMDNKKKHEQEVNHSINNSNRHSSDDILKLGGSTYLSKNGDLSFDSTHSNTSVNGSNDSQDKLLKEKKPEIEVREAFLYFLFRRKRKAF
ncbi:hypothetical protein LOTGIDRAFT_209451 [Lottia gigantea]|uniref:Cadherin domain-containing protein n=1 Tax=Lottia gigantea TaxID=225164 RepID=V4AK54_LOTGI|nr:hypothetical protein LOTGIDRAFT_209451 [Lottia gigantea]ESO93926.1 hypothetical protein LOTGIDRAFT_209451 [Lottia gigantea]